MLSHSEFSLNFSGWPVPHTLQSLLDFDNDEAQGSYYAPGFELISSDQKLMLRTYSEHAEFLNRLHEFAQADASGSIYALWQPEGTTDLEQAPVVIFGSEGGYHIVASSVGELLEILAYDAEPMVSWERVSYYRDETGERSPQHTVYLTWLRKKNGIAAVRPAEDIVTAAQQQYSTAFADWIKLFVPLS